MVANSMFGEQRVAACYSVIQKGDLSKYDRYSHESPSGYGPLWMHRDVQADPSRLFLYHLGGKLSGRRLDLSLPRGMASFLQNLPM